MTESDYDGVYELWWNTPGMGMKKVCVCNGYVVFCKKEQKVVQMASTIQVRVDDDLKVKSDQLFKDLGTDMTTAIRMFLTPEGFCIRLSACFYYGCKVNRNA